MLDIYDVSLYGVCATSLEGDVSEAKPCAQVELWKNKIEEAVQNDLDWSGENQLAEEDELEAKRRSTCLSEMDRRAQAEKCRDEEDKAKIEVKNGLESCSRMEMSWCCSSVDTGFQGATIA